MADKEMIEEKIGEALGLEKAAQKGVEELESRGLLKPEHMKKLGKMKEEASRQEQQMEELVQLLIESDGLDSEKIESTAEETAEKVSKIMETYLGEEPDTQEALEFLCLAEGGEVTHYEVLASIAKDVTNKKFGKNCKSNPEGRTGSLTIVHKASKDQCCV